MLADISLRPRFAAIAESVPGIKVEYSSNGSMILTGEVFGQNQATGAGRLNLVIEGDMILGSVNVEAGDTAYEIAKKLEAVVDRGPMSMDVTRLRGDTATMSVRWDTDDFEAA
jgi:hypothetical protein